jgi:two-component system sensor histidine kinase YesM
LFKFMIRKTNDLKIRYKLVFSIICIVFIPVLIVGIILTVQLRQMALNDATKQTLNNVERVHKRTLEILNVPLEFSTQLLFDSRLKALVNRNYMTVYEVVKAYQDYPDFRDYIRLHKEISNIRFYMDNPTLINNWEFFQPNQQLVHSAWYQAAIKSKGLVGWDFIEDERNHLNELSLVRRIDFLDYHNYGVLVINVNTNYLNSYLEEEPFETMIVDENNYIVSANRTGLIGKTLDELKFDRSVITKESGTYESVLEGNSSKIIIDKLQPESSHNSIRIVSVFSIASTAKDANRIIRLALYVIIISLVVAILLIYGVSKLLSNRLLRLSKHISKVASGNLNAFLEIDGKDEIAQISRQFNSMVGSVKELMLEVQTSQFQKNQLEIKQNEIKFKMLASQINPHFLFNALESIRMKAHLKGESEIAQAVRHLGKLIRRNLEVGSGRITLINEIEMVRCYLEIQQFRFEDRVSYELEIDPQALHLFVPPLIIQPLVENAVIHGLEDKEDGGAVFVKAEIVDEELHIEVLDNGKGMDESKVNDLVQSLGDAASDNEKNHIGLRNVHLRLQLSYGAQYGLTINSEPDKGTRVHFCIPIRGEPLV